MTRYISKFNEGHEDHYIVQSIVKLSEKNNASQLATILIDSIHKALNHETIGSDKVNYGKAYWDNFTEAFKQQVDKSFK